MISNHSPVRFLIPFEIRNTRVDFKQQCDCSEHAWKNAEESVIVVKDEKFLVLVKKIIEIIRLERSSFYLEQKLENLVSSVDIFFL